MSKTRVLICGGGTGGHFYSGLALAEKILKNYPEFEIHFIGTRYGIEAHHQFEDERIKIHFIHSKGIKGKSFFSKMLGLLSLGVSIIESSFLLMHLRPKLIFGVGGYVSGAPLLAGLLLKIFGQWKVALLEQNFVAGMTNDSLKKYVDRAFSAFETPGFEVIDLPLRQKLVNRAEKTEPSSWPPQTILVLGGSQGALGLNNKIIEMLSELKNNFPEIRFIHQTGPLEEKRVRAAYKERGVVAKVIPFSNDMPALYREADLVICRAGAMTVFEVMAFKRPTLFIPFPYATEDHQLKNALAVQEPDWVVPEPEFSWEKLLKILQKTEPAVPQRKNEVRLHWDQVLSSLMPKKV